MTRARSFAVRFAWEYLSSSPRNRGEQARQLAGFASPELVAELVPRPAVRGSRQVVQGATVAGSVPIDGGRALVTVAVRLAAARRVSSRLLTVPVAHDGRDGLVVDDLPSFASAPPRARSPRPESQPLAVADRAQLEDLLTRFFRAYLAGAVDDLRHLIPPGARIGAAAGRYELASPVSTAEPVPAAASRNGRLALATVQARDAETGVVYALRYRVRLVRRDRWYVAKVNGAGPGGER